MPCEPKGGLGMTGGCERGAPIACKSQKSKTAGSDNVEEVLVALCG